MPAKPHARNWNDVQTAIAMAAVVTVLGMWNLLATPGKTVTVQAKEPTLPPTEPPVTPQATSMPQVKIIFTQVAPQTTTTTVLQQTLNPTKKKHKNNGGGGSGSASVTQTKSS